MDVAKDFKDLFSAGAADYARYRPTYPPALFAWLAAQAPSRTIAVDVGTGSGQAAIALAEYFDAVVGLDPSTEQLANASPHPRVRYEIARAQATGLPAASVDLLTAGQAFHWFAETAFFEEARRVLRSDGVLAVWAYALTTITPEVDAVVLDYYERYLGRYWEPERRLVEDGYRSVAFPFRELPAPRFEMQLEWSFAALAGYLGTWSPLKRYLRDHGTNPLEEVLPRLEAAWGDAPSRLVRWPLSLRAFKSA